MSQPVVSDLTDEALEAEQHASGVQSQLDGEEIVALRKEVERLSAQLQMMDKERGAQRERAEVAEQEVAHLRDRLERTTAVLVAERREVFRLADERDAMATRLAAQTVMIRRQQMVIDHLRRPPTARLLSRVVRLVKR